MKYGEILFFSSKDMELNESLISIEGHNSLTYFFKQMTDKNPNLDLNLVHTNAYTNFVKFCPFVLKILSRNEILTSIKGYNSVTNNVSRMMR